MPTFQPPVAFDNPPIYVNGQDYRYPARPFGPAQALMRHFGGQARGRSVLKIGGVYQTIDTPSTDQCASATEVYLGGHIYEVSDDVAIALDEAGYTVAGVLTTVLQLETAESLLAETGDRILQEA